MDLSSTNNTEQPEWVAIPAQLEDELSSSWLSRRHHQRWALVLQARHIPCHSENAGTRFKLLVPADCFHQALQELRNYEQENRNWPPLPPPPVPLNNNYATTLWVLIATKNDLERA